MPTPPPLSDQPSNFQPEWYAAHTLHHLRIRTDAAYRLWTYDAAQGIYVEPDAVPAIHRHVSKLVSELASPKLFPRPRQGEEVVKILKRLPPTISDQPARPGLIGFTNGVIDTGQRWQDWHNLQPHSPDNLLTSVIPHKYQQDAPVNNWHHLLSEIVPTAHEQLLIQQAFGAALSNGKQPKGALLLVGETNTGKSTILQAVAEMVGHDNVTNLTPQQLTERFMPADLFGKKANLAADMPLGQIRDTSVFKQATGNDIIVADIKNGKPIRFRSTATWICAANQLPEAGHDRTHAYYGRLVPLPMNNPIPDKKQDPDHISALLADPPTMAGLINWAFNGLRDLQEKRYRYDIPQQVQNTREAYILEQNHHLDYLTDNYARHPDAKISRAKLRTHYQDWCERQGIKPWSSTYLYRRIREQWGNERKTAGRYIWDGHQLTDDT